jgi:hypothetical protein
VSRRVFFCLIFPTLPVARLPPDKQARIDTELLALTRKGKGKRGVKLRHMIEEVILQLGTADAKQLADGMAKAAAKAGD